MKIKTHSLKIFKVFFLLMFMVSNLAFPQINITSPEEYFGHSIGEDYWLMNYSQMVEYWKILEPGRLSILDLWIIKITCLRSCLDF